MLPKIFKIFLTLVKQFSKFLIILSLHDSANSGLLAHVLLRNNFTVLIKRNTHTVKQLIRNQ